MPLLGLELYDVHHISKLAFVSFHLTNSPASSKSHLESGIFPSLNLHSFPCLHSQIFGIQIFACLSPMIVSKIKHGFCSSLNCPNNSPSRPFFPKPRIYRMNPIAHMPTPSPPLKTPDLELIPFRKFFSSTAMNQNLLFEPQRQINTNSGLTFFSRAFIKTFLRCQYWNYSPLADIAAIMQHSGARTHNRGPPPGLCFVPFTHTFFIIIYFY